MPPRRASLSQPTTRQEARIADLIAFFTAILQRSPTASHPVTDTFLFLLEVILLPTLRFGIDNMEPDENTTRETAATRIPRRGELEEDASLISSRLELTLA